VVLEGSFNTEQPTPTQIESLKQMVAWLTRKYKIPSRTSKDTAITQRPPAQGKSKETAAGVKATKDGLVTDASRALFMKALFNNKF